MLKSIGCLAALSVAALVATTSGTRAAGPLDHENLIANGGFEEDNDNLRAERMSCPVRARVTYGQSDSIPDRWNYDPQKQARVRPGYRGQFAGIVPAAGKLKLTQPFTYGLVTRSQPSLPALRLSGFVKGSGGQDSISAQIVLSIIKKDEKTGQGQVTPVFTLAKSFPAPASWTEIALDVPTAEIEKALKAGTQPAGVVSGTLTLETGGTSGQVLIDELKVTSDRAAAAYTLVPNAGFESTDPTGRPAEWSSAKKSLRYFGSNYYVWRDWYHFLNEPRGVTSLDSLVVRSGKASLHLNAPPGDDRYVETAAIALNQTAPRRMTLEFDYNSYLLANLLVQVVDEEGREVYAQNIVPGTTGGWTTYRTEFLPRKAQLKAVDVRVGSDLFGATGDARPLKSCRVRIGVKGVNGTDMDDINRWVNVNHVGQLWVDNVALGETESTAAELTARGAKTFPLADESAGLAIAAIDLGERLYGENTATLTLANRDSGPASGTITMTLSGPFRDNRPRKAGFAVGAVGQQQHEPAVEKLAPQVVSVAYQVPAGGQATVALPYKIGKLLDDWRSEYRVSFAIGSSRTLVSLGTWNQQALVEVEKCYPFPEDKTQPVFMNLGVATKTLDRLAKLRLEIRRAADDSVVFTREVADLPATKEAFNDKPLPTDFEGDATNFVLTDFSLEALPVHSQTEPVRDHYVAAIGQDAAGQTLFSSRSPRFGRMEAHSEKLDAISSVSIHKDNYLLVNGKPLYARGHIWMQQNFGPSPLARKNTDWKRYGFNVKAGTQSPMPETSSQDPRYQPGVDELWSMHNTYLSSQMVASPPPLSPTVSALLQKWLGKPHILGIHFVPWEGEPAGGTPEALVQYAKDIKAAIGGRPLWVSAGWFAPRVNGRMEPSLMEHDWFAPENNAYFQPSQLDKEILANKAGRPCVLSTYPNVFNDAPWNVQRFEHWTEIIRHHTGYLQIGKPGDPSLMAGMNGELRYIEKFLFSPDKTPAVDVAPAVEHMVRSTPEANYVMATNAGPVIGGDWVWSASDKDQGRAWHTGTSLWSRFHPYMHDYFCHFYRDDRGVRVGAGDRLVQYVYVPTGTPVDCLMLMPRQNGEWRSHAVWGKFDHQQFTDSGVRLWMAKDMHQMSWGSLAIGFCGPEGHDPKNPKLLQYTFTADQFHKLGELPAAGKWVRLEIPVEQLGLVGKVIDGFGFVSKGAKVRWERTLLVQNGKEIPLCDGSAGIPPEALAKVRFNVEGLKAGTKVKVCFENRDVTAADGYFEDDLSGEPGYQNLYLGMYGDKLGETGYYGNGVNYNYNWGKVAARLYRIPK